jgi:hypothetical protein
LKIVMAMNKEFNFKNNFEMTISRKRNNWKWFLFQTHDPVHFSYFIQLFPLFHIYIMISMTLPARFGLIWFSVCRAEDLDVKVYDVWLKPSDCKSLHGLCPGKLKRLHI